LEQGVFLKNSNIVVVIFVAFAIIICCVCLVLTTSGIFLFVTASGAVNSNNDGPTSPEINSLPNPESETNPNQDSPNADNLGLFPSIHSEDLASSFETLAVLQNTYIQL